MGSEAEPSLVEESAPEGPTDPRRLFEPFVVAVFALWVAWHFGHIGFMPLDHSVVFDGGWRILGGQLPWRDFDLPSFVTPSAMQAVFFGLFGVSWSSFVMHAALANLAFAMGTRSLVLRLGGGRKAGLLCGLVAALLFYPPVGAPFADQHSFLFALLAVWAAVAARGHGRRSDDAPSNKALLLWALIPLTLLAGFLSKQLPSALMPLVVLLVLAAPGPRPRREGLVGLGLGLGLLAVVLAVAAALFRSAGGDLAHVGYCLFELPLAEAEQRRAYMPEGLRLVGRVLGAGSSIGAFRFAWLHLGLGLAVAVLLWRGRRPGSGVSAAWLPLTLGLALLLLGQVTMVLANNQDAAAVAFVVPGIGLLLAAAGRVALPARGALVGLGFVLLLSEPVLWWSDLVDRATNDLAYDPALAERLTDEDSPVLAGLAYQTPEHHPIPAGDLCAMADLLAERTGDFLLIGDSAVLYAMAGKRSALPSLWYHPGVTIPPKGSAEFRAWQDRMVAEVADGSLDCVVIEVEGTWIGNWTLADLPRVRKAVRERGFSESRHGVFRLLELEPLP